MSAGQATPGQAAPLHPLDLAASWEASARSNRRAGQELLDQGDEYGSDGIATADALDACAAALRAALAARPAQDAPAFRTEVEAVARTLREESQPYPGEDPAEVARRGGFGYAAGELEQVLARHPETTPGRAASPLLSDNREVMDGLMDAMGNPGRFLPRAPAESYSSWQRRAIVEHIAPLVIAHAERHRPVPDVTFSGVAPDVLTAVVEGNRDLLAARQPQAAHGVTVEQLTDALQEFHLWVIPAKPPGPFPEILGIVKDPAIVADALVRQLSANAAHSRAGQAAPVGHRPFREIAAERRERAGQAAPELQPDFTQEQIADFQAKFAEAMRSQPVRFTPGHAAPELRAAMAETTRIRERYHRLLNRFAKGTSGWTARIGQAELAREYRDVAPPVPGELRRFL